MDDAALLRSYADTGSENAFAEFVRRHLRLVYAAALRRLGGDAHAAEDVTQMVFTAVARDAGRLARHANVTGWLFTTTRFLAAKCVRREQRRRAREHVAVLASAAEGEGEHGFPDAVEKLGPLLDDALMELRELDRQMLLMRFYRGLRLAEIAAEINSSENAVQKRIERALAKLDTLLSRRGMTSTAAALAFALEQHAAVAVPAGLASTATTAGLAGGGSGVAAVPGSVMATATKWKLATAALLLAGGGVAVVWYQRENVRLRAELSAASAAPLPARISSPPPGAAAVVSPPVVAPTVAAPPPAASVAAPPVAPIAIVSAAAATPPASPADERMVPLEIEYPRPLFAGTPRPIRMVNLEPLAVGKRPAFLVPSGARLLSQGKPVTSSDALPVIGELSYVTDGDKSGTDGTYVELGPNPQWIQIDLGTPAWIDAIAVWHFHSQSRVYHDVIVQIAADPGFRKSVVTVYNNDHDNSSRLGRGRDLAYIETFQGRIFDGRRTRGQYVRLYSNGNTSDELNHYVEVEVYGRR